MQPITREDALKVQAALKRQDAMLSQAQIALTQGVQLMAAAAEEFADEDLFRDQLNLALLAAGVPFRVTRAR